MYASAELKWTSKIFRRTTNEMRESRVADLHCDQMVEGTLACRPLQTSRLQNTTAKKKYSIQYKIIILCVRTVTCTATLEESLMKVGCGQHVSVAETAYLFA